MRGEEFCQRKHHRLLVWQKAMDLVGDLYGLTKNFPKEELYCLTSQIRRAAVSVPSNIAEGAGRSSDKEFLQYLYISRGSLTELETQIFISKRIGYVKEIETILVQITSILKLLNGLINSVKKKISNESEN